MAQYFINCRKLRNLSRNTPEQVVSCSIFVFVAAAVVKTATVSADTVTAKVVRMHIFNAIFGCNKLKRFTKV